VRKLAAPLRVTWDWDWPPVAHPAAPPRRPPPDLVREVGRELVRARVLLLEVGYPDPAALAGGELARALDGFAGQLSLVLGPAAAAALGASGAGASPGAAELWLDITPAGPDAAPTALAGTAPWEGVRLYLTAGNLRAAAALLVDALARGASRVSLPCLPLFGAVLAAPERTAPTPAQLREFADLILPALEAAPGVDLRVHHYGLSELLRARGLRPAGEEAPGHTGCQAGTALAYVDPLGVLYPCASLPIPLERMGEGAIARAWAGEELRLLRGEIGRLPDACGACPAGESCRGGCRGWAQFLSGTWTTPGPDCTRS
jgi:radical SAM protein with 4Fe4S-binding SPASM domain